jgi:uncharacterized protein YutE (UPF0331/DUF86 family)
VTDEHAVIRDKLTRMAAYLQELEPLGRRASLDEYRTNSLVKHSAERLIELIVEAAVDINGLLVTLAGSPPPRDYYASFLAVGRLRIYPERLGKQLARTAGLRNRLAHEYEAIDDAIVYQNVRRLPSLYRDYIRSISRYLGRAGSRRRRSA